jgi:hypothetical protein
MKKILLRSLVILGLLVPLTKLFSAGFAITLDTVTYVDGNVYSRGDLLVEYSPLDEYFLIYPYVGLGLGWGTVGGKAYGRYTDDNGILHYLVLDGYFLMTEIGVEGNIEDTVKVNAYVGYDFNIKGQPTENFISQSVYYRKSYLKLNGRADLIKLGVHAYYCITPRLDLGLVYTWSRINQNAIPSSYDPNSNPDGLQGYLFDSNNQSLNALGLSLRAHF